MAATRRQHKNQKESAWVPPLQRDPGPWNRLLLNWLATLAIIMVFGLVMLYSASYTTGYLRMGDSFHYIKQQALCMMIGLACMFLMSYMDHRFLRKMVVPGYIIVLAMLAVTLTMAPLNGCRRWIRFGGLTLQSSEVAKFEMILFSSHLAAKAPQVERLDPERRILLTPREWLRVRVWKQLVVPVLPLIPVVLLLAMEPHMSGIVLTVAVVGTILLLSGSGGVLTWAGAITAGALLETLLSHVDSIPYLQKRLDGWTQDLSKMTDQTVQSLYAIGSGGLLGVGLVITLFQLPMSTFIMRNAFDAIPKDMEEAAMVDGCNSLQALFKILVPVVKPSMVTVGLLAFLEAWNNFMIPLYLSSSSKSTLPLAMVNMRQQTMGVIDYGATEAGVVILLIPCAILFLALQKYYVKGFMAGAVKG